MAHPLLSAALQEAYASAQTEVTVIDLVELRYGTERLLLCKGLLKCSVQLPDGSSHAAYPFPFKLANRPSVDTSGGATVTLSVENVKGQVFSFLTAAKVANTPVNLFLWTCLAPVSADLATFVLRPQNPREIKLEVVNAKATMAGVVLTASAPNLVNKVFPNARYTYTTFPGLRG